MAEDFPGPPATDLEHESFYDQAQQAGKISVIGMCGESLEGLHPAAAQALLGADLVVGGVRQLDSWRGWMRARGFGADIARTKEILADLAEVLEEIAASYHRGHNVAVLASGDPGFFGVLRPLVDRFGEGSCAVYPAPSSVSLAFARLSIPWDDAVVVSVHARPLERGIRALKRAAQTTGKAAVLVSPSCPPEAVGAALQQEGVGFDRVAVCTRVELGATGGLLARRGTGNGCGAASSRDGAIPSSFDNHGHSGANSVVWTDLKGLAKGRWDPLSVVVLLCSKVPQPTERVLAWGLDEANYERTGALITKAEVRAAVLGKLALPSQGVMWDIGAGSGSVAIECSLLQPSLRVIAIEADRQRVSQIERNALQHSAKLGIVLGTAPAALGGLPDPDRVFVGGGGIDVLCAAMERLKPGGRAAATFASLDRAAAAAELCGNLVQITANRASKLPDGSWRLNGANPVFLCWGEKDAQ
ncbi:MAG: precorrin-6y C5,15-methyltransferase (decarboxylating) subunit CbiE [Actinobacteria bacterium]|nr:precorrin-6y C5,15-methyltransferase (decarboxylating) subunit CbiE [Actinomycetota bacterium]